MLLVRDYVAKQLTAAQPLTLASYNYLVECLQGSQPELSNETESHRLPSEIVDSFLLRVPTQAYFLSPTELCEITGIPEAELAQILQLFSCERGNVRADYTNVTRVSTLSVRPLIHFPGNKIFFGLIDYLPWAIRPRIEEFLNKKGASDSNKVNVWEKYLNARSEFVCTKTKDFLGGVVPDCTYYTNLKYSNPDDPGVETELDALLVIDDTALVIECKAGTFAESAKRGGELKPAVERTVGDASRQAVRAIRYIAATDIPTFICNGKKLTISSQQIKKYVPVVVLLEAMDPVTTKLPTLKELGWLGVYEGKYPWVVSLLDLRIICEMTEWSGQLLHYLSRRQELSNDKSFHFTEELDLFGAYLQNGLSLPSDATNGKFSDIFLGSRTEIFDNYYMAKRLKPTSEPTKPRINIAPNIRELINELERARFHGYTLVCRSLLDLSGEAQVEVSQLINRMLAKALRDGSAHDFSIEVADNFGFTIIACPDRQSIEFQAEKLRMLCAFKKYKSRQPFWWGCCLLSNNPGIALEASVCLPFEWIEDPDLETACVRFENISGIKLSSSRANNDVVLL